MTSIEGYKLWAFTSALNNYMAPFTVVAVPCAQHSSNFYAVSFQKPPDFSKYGLSTTKHFNNNTIVYMSESELVSRGDSIPVVNDDWPTNRLRYHSYGALYNLGIVPSLSSSLFTDQSRFESLENDLRKAYNMNRSMCDCLDRIFADALYALDFLGFTTPSNPEEETAVKFAAELSHHQAIQTDSGAYFAFGNIGFVIAKYHRLCYPKRKLTEKCFSPSSYNSLINTIYLVSSLLKKLDIHIVDDDFKSSLLRGIQRYKDRRRIDEPKCGKTTLRSLLFETNTLYDSSLEKTVGYQKNQKESQNTFDVNLKNASKLNELIQELPNTSDMYRQLYTAISQTINRSNHVCDSIHERIDSCSTRIESIGHSLDELTKTSDRIDAQLDQATNALDSVLNEHIKIQERLIALRIKISSEKRSNRILGICSILIIAALFYNFIKHTMFVHE